jgi:TctA family transporter
MRTMQKNMDKTSSVGLRGSRAILASAECLSLAAAPCFALMALLASGVPSDASTPLICSVAQGSSWLGGMAPMYLSMSAFHLVAWLKWMAARRIAAGELKE